MPANKSVMYHAILDLLDKLENTRAAHEMQQAASSLSTQEFALLLNAFIRRGVQVRTA